MSTPEGAVKAKVKKFLKDLGAWQYWPVSSGMGKHGVPDCLACYNGHMIAIECKAPGKRGHKNRGATALQQIQINEINDAGGTAIVCDGAEDLEKLREQLKGVK